MRTEIWRFMVVLAWSILLVCSLAYFLQAELVTLPGGIEDREDATAPIMNANLEALRDGGVNRIESVNVVDGTLTNDDISSNDSDRIAMEKVGDPHGSMNDGLQNFIRGAHCSITSGDFWKIGAGEIAIVDSDGDAQWCTNTGDTTAVSVNTDLGSPGDASQGQTYYGFAVDDGAGGYTSLTKTTSGESADQRLVCTIVMADSGDPPGIDSVTDTQYYFHAGYEDLADWLTCVKRVGQAGTWVAVDNQKIVYGWSWILVNSDTEYETRNISFDGSGITYVRNYDANYIGWVPEGDAPASWTEFTSVGEASSHPTRISWGSFNCQTNPTSGFYLFVGRSNNNYTVPANDSYLAKGYYGFHFQAIGD